MLLMFHTLETFVRLKHTNILFEEAQIYQPP